MIKRHEREYGYSCWNRAAEGEIVFVLLGRDVSTPAAIRVWVKDRLLRGKNLRNDAQILEALATADEIERNQNASESDSTPTVGGRED